MSIRALYFDLGGVIVRTGDKSARTRLGAEFGMTYDEMDKFVFECKSSALASLGKISSNDDVGEPVRCSTQLLRDCHLQIVADSLDDLMRLRCREYERRRLCCNHRGTDTHRECKETYQE